MNFFVPLIVLLSLLALPQGNSVPITELPLSIEPGNWVINAVITPLKSPNSVYQVREYVHADENRVRGKIEIHYQGETVSVFHNNANDKKRVIIKDNKCHFVERKNSWFNTVADLFGNHSLRDHVLVIGPSILFRLQNASPPLTLDSPSTKVRGTAMKMYKASLGTIEIDIYSKVHFSEQLALARPSRLTLSQVYSNHFAPAEQINIDYMSIEKSHQQLDAFISVTPEIGCPDYLTDREPKYGMIAPSINLYQFHLIETVTVDGPKKSFTRNEIYVNSQADELRVKKTVNEETSEVIYDYKLGIFYDRVAGYCNIRPVQPTSPGLSKYGNLDLFVLLQIDHNRIQWVGRTVLKHRSDAIVDVWESVSYNVTMESGHYDRIVYTHYMASSQSTDSLFRGNSLVGSTISAYNEGPKGDTLIETTRKEYYNVERVDDRFNFGLKAGDCYPGTSGKKTIAYTVHCQDDDCIKLAERRIGEFKNIFLQGLVDMWVSIVRVDTIEYHFMKDEVVITVTFLPTPPMTEAFNSSYVRIDEDYLTGLPRFKTENMELCLRNQASDYTPVELVLFCSLWDGDKICTRVTKKSSLKEDPTGIPCNVFATPYKNFYRYNREVTVEKLTEINSYSNLRLGLFDYGKGYTNYKITKVTDVTRPEDPNEEPHLTYKKHAKLPEKDVTVLKVTSVSNLGDCYRTCVHGETGSCETFSFCTYPDKVACFTSAMPSIKFGDNLVEDKSCVTYEKNRLFDYLYIPNRKYKNPAAISTSNWAGDCAALCSRTDGCSSFQECGGLCTFGGLYTDSSTEYDEKCQIYIPRVSHQYEVTGNKIVAQVTHTEFSLDIDQCAALCSQWDSGDERCLSFNFCPQRNTPSSCSLTKYSVSDPSTETQASDTCQNYESRRLIEEDKTRQKAPSDQRKGTNGGAAFGIIVLFMFSGLVIGLILPITLTLLRSKSNLFRCNGSSEENSFTWSRQVDQET